MAHFSTIKLEKWGKQRAKLFANTRKKDLENLVFS